VAALLVGLIGATVTVIIASKRAVFAVAEAALTELALGSALFQALFQHLLGVSDDTERGERMGATGGALETRLPLVTDPWRARGKRPRAPPRGPDGD
jgi:hypothetical protein